MYVHIMCVANIIYFLHLQYTMLCGNAPFYGQSLSTEEIMERIRVGQFSFDAPEWIRVSQAAKSIIEGTHNHHIVIEGKFLKIQQFTKLKLANFFLTI